MGDSKRVTAYVKWFNNKSGYGFASTLGEDEPRDVFVHHTSIQVKKEQYRFLVQGEYIELDVSPISEQNSKHQWQSANVTGIHGGPLMCVTRQDMRDNSNTSKKNDVSE
jgi:cold shock CspA family protein|tara:strand:+ start:1611 stop:1937 length:327 start_codon:yes stop_codon:yes gene_type:complete